MKKAYLAISYSKRKQFNEEVNELQKLFTKNKIELLVFVDQYNFKPNQEKEMMTTAFEEIEASDFLIAELTYKSIGVGIEIGYARAKGIPVVYLYRIHSEYSTTASGSADFVVEYDNKFDLIKLMERVLKKNMKTRNLSD